MDSTTKTLYIGEYEAEKRFKTLVFPNPASEGLIKFKCFTHFDDAVLIRVFDPLGQLVQDLHFTPEFNGKNIFEWRSDVLRPGAYFYEILLNGQHESSGRILVVKP